MRLQWPTVSEMKKFAILFGKSWLRDQIFQNIFASVDTSRLPCANYVDLDKRNWFYEGYTQCVEVTNLLICNFKGEIIHAAMNYSESRHDGKVAVLSWLHFSKLGDDMTTSGMVILE